ncbi:protein of unknown function [Candidatus Filomicrobium marinum]|nr:protein of unknown function [Candidatus Filomicrobium marinum]
MPPMKWLSSRVMINACSFMGLVELGQVGENVHFFLYHGVAIGGNLDATEIWLTQMITKKGGL